MPEFFQYDYDGPPFEQFGTAHLAFIFAILLIVLWLIFAWKQPSERAKKITRYTLAGLMLLGQGGWQFFNLYWGTWDARYHLPLHASSLMTWFGIFMLLTKNYTIYEFSYFLGIAAGMQVVLTPGAGQFGYPHFRMIQLMVTHGIMIIGPVYLTTKEGLRPTWTSFWRVLLFTNLYMVPIFFLNFYLESNYLFLRHKPPSISILDAFGLWPWYILWMEVLGIVIFLLLYLPFAIRDWRKKLA